MDRDEALRLLKGGPEGVAEWNRHREASERIPDFSKADLGWANLARADLVGVSLDGARCWSTIFADVDLSTDFLFRDVDGQAGKLASLPRPRWHERTSQTAQVP